VTYRPAGALSASRHAVIFSQVGGIGVTCCKLPPQATGISPVFHPTRSRSASRCRILYVAAL